MNKKNIQRLATVCLFEMLHIGFSCAPAWAETNNSTLQTLFDQANYWHNKANDKLAIEPLNKVLLIDANNPQALYLMALWAEQRGDINAAAQWRKQLEKIHPDSPQLQKLQNAKQLKQLPQNQLTLARQQARSGNINAALRTFEDLFNDQEPPLALAPEYYLTMSSDKTRYQTALNKLKELSKRYPENTSVTIAFAKVLTYRQNTRRKGMNILEKSASSQQEADSSLRQALLWLNPTLADEHYYTKWTSKHPKDREVFNYFKQKVTGGISKLGFDKLNKGDLASAEKAFKKVLQYSPKNADALAGMGYVFLKRNDYVVAASYLNRSAAQGGKKAKTRKKQAQQATFYIKLAEAKNAYKRGDLTAALTLSAPLAKQSGEFGVTAKLFRAELLRKNGDRRKSARLLRSILKKDPANNAATEQLYYVLKEQNNTKEALQLLNSMTASQQLKIQSKDSYGNIRTLADQAIQAGNIETAIGILKDGVISIPNNPWLRLELARLLVSQNKKSEAQTIITYLARPEANNESLYAAALFAKDNKDWQHAYLLLNRIPATERDTKSNALYDESHFNIELDQAHAYLSKGNKNKALTILRSIGGDILNSPNNAGQLAKLMAKAGAIDSAVKIVQHSLTRDINGNAQEYSNHIAILYQAGLLSEAQRLLSNPQLQANSTPLQLTRARNIYVANEADNLRESSHYAKAYDLLTRALQLDPENTALMMALARLYQSGKMNDEAGAIYDYLLKNGLDANDQGALKGAINIAIANGNITKLRKLAEQLNDSQTPSHLLLLAQIYKAEGNYQQAKSSLREARGKLLNLNFSHQSTTPMQGGLILADNPFISQTAVDADSQSLYGATMPWQVADSSDLSNSQRIDHPDTYSEQKTLNEVNNMLLQINEKTSSWVQGGLIVRERDGESGLSKLSETRAPLQWSNALFADSRFTIDITAVTLDAGSSSDDASLRFGTGALEQGELAEEEGSSTLDGDTLPDVDSQGEQSDTGVEIAMAIENDHLKFDIGTTPLGLERVTLVGGAQWSPQLDNFLTLTLTGERRSIKESLLSYVGVVDQYSGNFWGQVTKNGLHAQINYDDGDAGFYAGVGAWEYLGTNVADNNSVALNAGMYTRPYQEKTRQLKTGVTFFYKNFSENLSYFSYGHGGYFSPQNYAGISFPVDYQQDFSKMSVSVGGALGYQSYSLDKVEYFPNDTDLQTELESYLADGEVEDAYYSADSVNGIGYNFYAGLKYKVQQNLTLEVKFLYDTFGEYNEFSGNISLSHTFKEY